jgi:hypothetical protein
MLFVRFEKRRAPGLTSQRLPEAIQIRSFF